MMRDINHEMQRKLHQDQCTQDCKFDHLARMYGKHRSEFIAEVVLGRRMWPICEDAGRQHLKYEYARTYADGVDLRAHLEQDAEDALREAPPRSSVHAVVEDILSSYDDELLSAMRDWKLPDIEVNRVGAHIMSLGLGLSDDQFAAVTRRFTMGLMNRRTHEDNSQVQTQAADQSDASEGGKAAQGA